MNADHRKIWGAGYHQGIEKGKPKGQLLACPLQGKWFHSKGDNGKIKWQGHILGAISDGLMLVQLYGWSFGDPTVQKPVAVKDMANWDFYDSDKEMRSAWERSPERPALLAGRAS